MKIIQLKNLTLREIASKTKFPDVLLALKHHYSFVNWGPRHKKVFLRILNAPKRKQKDPNERADIYCVNEEYKEREVESYYGIHTKILKDKQKISYSMSFRPWDQLSNLLVSDETLNRYTVEDIIAHYIYELTFYGSEESAKKEYKKIMGRVKEIKKEHGKKKNIRGTK